MSMGYVRRLALAAEQPMFFARFIPSSKPSALGLVQVGLGLELSFSEPECQQAAGGVFDRNPH